MRMMLTVVVRDETYLRHVGMPATFRTLHLPLTDGQMVQLNTLNDNEVVHQVFLEPIKRAGDASLPPE